MSTPTIKSGTAAGPTLDKPQLRSMQRQLADASDPQLMRILAMVDAQKSFTFANNWSSHAATAGYLANEIREFCRHFPRHDPTGPCFLISTERLSISRPPRHRSSCRRGLDPCCGR